MGRGTLRAARRVKRHTIGTHPAQSFKLTARPQKCCFSETPVCAQAQQRAHADTNDTTTTTTNHDNDADTDTDTDTETATDTNTANLDHLRSCDKQVVV